MKKTLIISLVIAVTMLFCACGGNDSSDTSEKSAGTEEQSGEVELVSSGHTYNDGYLHVGAIVKNKDSNSAYEFYSVNVTAYGKDGSVLGTEEQTMGTIQPGERQGAAVMVDTSGKRPRKVEVEVDTGDKIEADDEAVKSSDLKCINIHRSKDEFGGIKVTGQIKNKTDKDLDDVYTLVLFKKGKRIVGAENTFVEKLKAKSKKAFEHTSYTPFKFNRVQVIALDWSF